MLKKTNLKKDKKNYAKINIILTISIFAIFLFMASGYAILNTKLTINGKGKLDIPEYQIFVNDIKVSETTNGGYQASNPTFTDNEIAMYTTLPNINSTVVYEVSIKNTGKTSAVVDSIYISCSNSNIKYRIIGVQAQDTIKGLSNLVVKIEVMYSEDATTTSENISMMLNFNFLKKTDTYSNACTLNWDGTSSTQPLTIDIYGKTYYQITNANELNWFKTQVEEGNNTINAILDNDICMNNNSFSISNTYNGIFDGQNRTIMDISYSRDVDLESNNTFNMGFFINNAGTIKNLNVYSTFVDKSIARTSVGNNYLGGIVVNNSGIVENCSYNGSIEVNSQAIVNCLVSQAHAYMYIGGISAKNTGIIRGCVNKANFALTGYASYSVCNIYTRSVNITSGGIVGVNTGYVSDSYNSAKMTANGSMRSTTRSSYLGLIGGVIGTNEKTCSNAYNSGSIAHTLSGNTTNSAFGAIGSNTGNLQNVYFLTGTADNNLGTEVGEGDLGNLNINIGNAFIKSTTYPKLFWE